MEKKTQKNLKFPDGFLWGSGTSAHQVEGHNHNDWTEWEKENAKRLAQHSKKYWEKSQHLFPEMGLESNYISGCACDHYNRYEEDFDIAKSLGQNAYRFSIEWSRIEPEEGVFNEQAIEHYRQVIWALKKRGIEPFVTLWHWTLPYWIAKMGGWEKRKTIDYFLRYTEKIIEELGDDVKFWITLNEPEIFSGNCYLKGIRPPQKKNILSYLRVIKNLIKAHKSSYKIIKKINPNSRIGIAKNNIYFEAYKNRITNLFLKKFIDWWWNFYFLNKIKNQQDFIGLNYYFHNRINKGFNKNENKNTTDMGWEIYPEGIYHVLKNLKKYNLPIYIIENGIADAKDEKREKFIKDHLYWIHKAIKEGVDIKGYFYWSLLDNFEWDKGFWPRFGLVEIDYQTMNRKIRPSALEYKKIIEKNAIE